MQRLISMAVIGLCGCASAPVPPSKLVPPASRCMVPPQSIRPLQVGDDLVPAYAGLARQYGREASKLRCVQKWVRTVTR